MKKNQARPRHPSDSARPVKRTAANRRPQRNAGGRSEPAAMARTTNELAPVLLNHTSLVLQTLLGFTQPADTVLSAYFREQRALGRRDRGFIAETCYTVLRHLRHLSKRVQPEVTPRRLVLAALLTYSGLSLRQISAALSMEEEHWLLALKTAAEPEYTPAEALDLPDWLVERLTDRLPAEELKALALSLNRSAALDLRVNSLKAHREEVQAQLADSGIEAAFCPYSPWGLRLKGKPALQQHPLFLNGTIEVQDEGSQLLGALLAPRRGEMVVDFCAGAGGKTLLLGALMRSTGRLYALDVAAARLSKLKPRVARSGLSNVHPIAITSENDVRVKRLAGKIDRVLVDAPCSGLGTVRRNPDLKWRQNPETVARLAEKQRDILASAARLVKPGGRLVYATCSILDEENQQIVDAFLAEHAEFKRLAAHEILRRQNIDLPVEFVDASCLDMRLLPHRHGTDGFYAAVLERIS